MIPHADLELPPIAGLFLVEMREPSCSFHISSDGGAPEGCRRARWARHGAALNLAPFNDVCGV